MFNIYVETIFMHVYLILINNVFLVDLKTVRYSNIIVICPCSKQLCLHALLMKEASTKFMFKKTIIVVDIVA